MSSRTGRRILVTATLLVVSVAAAVVAASMAGGEEAETAVVTRGSLDVTIETSGRLIPRSPAIVRSPAGGRASIVAVQPGDRVERGDVLVALDLEPFEAAVRQAEEQLWDAEAALNLAESAGGAEPSPAELAERLRAERRVREAERLLEAARDRRADSLIRAPRAGMVIELPAHEGAPVGENAIVAQIADLSDLEMTVEIDEIDLPRLDVGAEVTFTLDAYPGQRLDGRIVHIAPVAQTVGGTTTFPARVAFEAPADFRLRPGMNANVSIRAAVREDVLLVPEQALRTVGRRTFVIVVTEDGREEREIQVGLRGGGQVEVAAGLEEGDRVVLR